MAVPQPPLLDPNGGGARWLLGRFRSYRLAGFAMLLLLGAGLVQLLASILFYTAIDRQSIREDHARRVAELLVVSDRLHKRDPAATAKTMSTAHLVVKIGDAPRTAHAGGNNEVAEIRDHIFRWEHALAERKLFLDIAPGPRGKRDLIGSMQLADGSWLNFRSADLSSGWPIALRATVMTLVITLVCFGIGLLVMQRLMMPLRALADAAHAAAHGVPVPIRERGPADLRDLARSFNDMQARVSDMATEQARSFEAISHDLRTPLSRLKLASDFVSDTEISRLVSSSAEEMESMLASLQSFLRAQHLPSDAEPMDLVPAVRDLLARYPDSATTLRAPPAAPVMTYREPLLLALQPLVENALQYGSRADVSISATATGWCIAITDDGPGIPSDHFERILDPFYRLDSARARNTPGFGLGIPTAHQLLTRFDGKLSFANAPGGGLIAYVDVPIAHGVT